jgi:Tol biopolymer transport system component
LLTVVLSRKEAIMSRDSFILYRLAVLLALVVFAEIAPPAFAQRTKPEILLTTSLHLPSGSQIFRINADGSMRAPLTDGKKLEAEPVLSPDGTRIAFVADAGEKTVKLHLMNADGSNRKLLAEKADGNLALAPAWSPDGKRIAFCTVNTDNRAMFVDARMYVIDAGDRNLERLGKQEGLFPNWSPDGKRVLFTRVNANDMNLCMMDDRGAKVRVLIRENSVMGAWSLDGQSLAYVVLPPDQRAGLYVARRDGSRPQLLMGGPDEDTYSPHWSADSKRLFFTRRAPKEGGAVYVIDSDGRNPRRLTTGNSPECLAGALLFATFLDPPRPERR